MSSVHFFASRSTSASYKNLLYSAAIGSGFLSGSITMAAVPAADITLQKPVTDNVSTIAPNIGYAVKGAPLSGPEIPLYIPYDSQYPQWWDNLVQELLQARLTTLNLNNRGIDIYTPPPAIPTGGGNMDPRRLTQLLDAINRAGATGMFRFTNGVDTVVPKLIVNHRDGTTGPYDFSIASDWDAVWWQYLIKPWHDTIPSQFWYRIYGRPTIYLWGINGMTNQAGNCSLMLEFLRQKFLTTYGEDPVFVLDQNWFQYDPSVANLDCVVAKNTWYSNATGWNMATFAGYTSGAFFPGYGSATPPIPRNGVSGTGVNGDTFQAGLNATFNNNAANLMFLEGWTNNEESMALYRSKATGWDFPGQYINMLPFYTDMRTVTQRLEAEGADAFSDTTTGNSGGKFRDDDLDVKQRAVGNGWQVGWTAAGEWIEFKSVPVSTGNYKITVRYASPSARTLRLLIDGVAMPDVAVPATGGADTFDTIYLTASPKPLAHGRHTFRLQFVDGGVDVDWLFLKKNDPIVNLKSAVNNNYLTALKGGNTTLEANSSVATAWQHFTVDDLTGSLTSGNSVNLQAYDGLYVCAEGGGGGAVNANRRAAGSYESWKIVKVSGSGALANGDLVALQTSNGKYLTVQSNGYVYATATTIGTSETFTLQTTNVGTPPADPGNLSATAVSGSQINLSWTDNATNETAYFVERSLDRVHYTRIATLAANSTSYSNTGLSGYTWADYRVMASNATANSDYSNLGSASTLAGISATPINVAAYRAPSFTGSAATIRWSASDGATSYQVKRSTSSSGPFTNLGTASGTSYSDSTVSPGTTYYYVVAAFNGYGTSGNSSSTVATPTALAQQNISTGSGGSGSYGSGVFTIAGNGGDIWGTADTCRYAYQSMTGNGSIIARVSGITGSDPYSRSGLMMRESLNADSTNVLMSLLLNGSSNFQYRPGTGAASTYTNRTAGVSAPRWLRLDREGNVFNAYYSSDGETWLAAGNATITMPATIYVGIVQSKATTGTFDNVLILH